MSSAVYIQLAKPFFQFAVRIVDVASPNRKASQNLRFRAEFLDVAFAMPHAAPFMGTERNKSFAGEVILFQKGMHRHRHGAPPIGIPQKHHVISIHILYPLRQHGTGVLPQLHLGDFRGFPVIFGICRYCFYMEQIASHEALYFFCDYFSIADCEMNNVAADIVIPLAGKIRDQYLALFHVLLRLTDSICNYCMDIFQKYFLHSKSGISCFVNAAQSVQTAWIPDIGKALRNDFDEECLVIADLHIGFCM